MAENQTPQTNDVSKDEYGEVIGCDELHCAKVTADTDEAYTTATPEFLAPLAQVVLPGSGNINKRYYDNVVRYMSREGDEQDVSIKISGISSKKAAELLGRDYDSSKGIVFDAGSDDVAPWYALGGRMDLEGTEHRYFWYLKGQFSIGNTTGDTRTNTVNPNTTDLTFHGTRTVKKFTVNGKPKRRLSSMADTTDSAFTTASTWFDAVVVPTTTPEPEPEEN